VIVGVRTDASGDREFHVLLKAPTWVDLGRGLAGALGVPSLVGGGTLVGGTPWSLSLTHAFPATTAFYLIGFSELYAPFRGGVLVPAFDLFVPLPTGPGTLNLNLNSWPPGLPQGASIFFQVWIGDPGGPAGFAASNAVSGTSA